MSRTVLSRMLSTAVQVARAGPSSIVSSSSVPSRRHASSKIQVDTETLSTSSPYPFSSSAIFPTSPYSTSVPPPSNLLKPKKGYSVVQAINTSLLDTYDPLKLCKTLFSRRHPKRITPGSVLTVFSYNSPSRTTTSPFSGVLMGIKRAGVDTSFKLRNVVSKTGVEMSFKVCSPMIKEIRVVKRADGRSGLKNLRRAKVNYLRERPQMMAGIATALKASRT